ncbi:MAG: methyl-accepting chemotaxis protein [Pseudodesulfovibrio sp.]|uniref:PAS sensor protein n=2 Tax=Pseudodesulfovibrio TaxID=2035811 RepID=E6VT42_PSEA9|nr:methyl-accepting chemotaxis protein [Pseudodesulfovibrio sp.]ADU62092.1 PAS sensor protein [Pseudodesulfovibrio aespoeensis Aspo-2]MBU4192687.1 methyl-accepting chemotaxis protein [Pseudomonadota bacterium]MBU4244197.1 methyl-accepting chemotaxis protein [Pseudomonadota bacterium]MBU4474735.1 methyl-accepting chemotaxis protein [Pseudomonadota bacterium]MBU4515938.1 methyl-accepting chemotaxis protein [Pseudomonadota bacterium]
MSQSTPPYLRRFVALYFGVFALVAGASVWFTLACSGEAWAVAVVATAILGVFGLLGIALVVLLGRLLVGPVSQVMRYTAHVLDGNYAEADDAALAKAMPGLGGMVSELAGRFKERLGFSRSILAGLPVPCCLVDTGQNITFLNQECLDMIGSKDTPESFYGRKISQIFYRDDRKSVIGTCMDDTIRMMNREAVFKHVDGSDINVLANLFPLTDVTGKVIGGCCLYLDTTELKRREAEILSQNERIARAASDASAISEELAAAAVQLEGLVANARTGACVQTDRTGETATAMEQMNATVLEVARHAQDAALDADEARQRADEGAAVVTEVVQAIHEVATRAQELKSSMEELDVRAESIGKVLGVIEDIADQTNLLALNAAIEAARAGEAGRGFAVVADEVRKLAEKTMQATNEVHQAVTGIQDGARKNVRATEIAVSAVQKSTDMANRSGEALKSIVLVAESTADRVRSIATAAEQQSAASDEISRATMDVNRICGETDRAMAESAEAIKRLAGLAESLADVIRGMR